MSAKTITSGAWDGKRDVQESGVKRLLRHKVSLQYFKDGDWTHNPEEADSFSDIVEAVETCVRYGLCDVEIALRVDSGACDVFCTPIR